MRNRLVAWAVLAFAFAFVVRGYVCFHDLESFSADPDAYRAISRTVSDHQVFGLVGPDGIARPTAFRPPLYPLVLAGIANSNFGVASLHTLLGAITALATCLATWRIQDAVIPRGSEGSLNGGPFVGLAAATMVTLDPILLKQSSLVMTETIATALSALIIWCWTFGEPGNGQKSRWFAVTLGLLIALAYLCRPTFLVWGAMLSFVLLLRGCRTVSWRIRTFNAAVVSGMLLLSVAGWTVRNARAIGHPIWATSHGGYTLLLANNPLFYEYLRESNWGDTWDATEFTAAYKNRHAAAPTEDSFWRRQWGPPNPNLPGLLEYQDDQLSYRAAKATIAREPGTFVYACLVRVGRLWSPTPHQTTGRSAKAIVIVSIYYIAIFALLLVSLSKLRGRIFNAQLWSALLLFIALTTVHAVYWSNMRMRAPAVPAIAILASAALMRSQAENADVANT